MEYQNNINEMPLDKDLGPTVLIVDDEEGARKSLQMALSSVDRSESIQTLSASTIPEALNILSKNRVHVVLLDKNIGPDESDPKQNGIESIEEMLKIQPYLTILMITGSNAYQDAVLATKKGAFGYVTKDSPKELKIAQINLAIEHSKLKFEKIFNDRIKEQQYSESKNLGGNSRAWRETRAKATAFAKNDMPVTLLGETGTGKTQIVKFSHEYRKNYLNQKTKNFVNVNISAMSAEIAERELFGNEAGAFTDAKTVKIGYFELANKGTLFLDEIGDASLDLQKKILKVVDEGCFYRLGGTTEMSSEFKLYCATHRNLKQMVEDGLFREDLYMRIATLVIDVPSLSERKEDIPEIVDAFLPSICMKNKIPAIGVKDLPSDFVCYLQENDFPGNIRGLQHQVASLIALACGFSTKDKSGVPDFKKWKKYLEMNKRTPKSVETRNTATLKDILDAPTDIIGPDFSGIQAVIEKITDKIYREAREKFKTNNAVARALKVSKSTASANLTRIEKTMEPKGKIEKTGLRIDHKALSTLKESLQ